MRLTRLIDTGRAASRRNDNGHEVQLIWPYYPKTSVPAGGIPISPD
ncbi:hypothetical protein [Streptomyces celluloflavus]